MQKISFCERYMLTTAVLKRFKTNTRRLEKELENLEEGNFCFSRHKNGILLYGEKGSVIETIKTRYKIGEIVAVAQSYEDIYHHGGPEYGSYELVNNYRRLHIRPWKDITQQAGWLNKMFVRPDLMPHQIQITDINIERLQDITDDDCLKEGIEYSKYERNWFYTNDKNTEFHAPTPREAFAALINRPGVGRKGLWEENPFVVVYSFKLLK